MMKHFNADFYHFFCNKQDYKETSKYTGDEDEGDANTLIGIPCNKPKRTEEDEGGL